MSISKQLFFDPELAKKVTETGQKILKEMLKDEDVKILIDVDSISCLLPPSPVI